jgi:hypothetical protein
VLYELPLEETIVFLGEQQRDNLFSGIQYPESGLFLRKLTIFLKENVGDAGGLKYYIDIRIRCTFDREGFNNRWSEFSFDKLSFDDEDVRFLENSMGVCLDPRFASKEKYEQIKESLLTIRKELQETLTV